MAGDDTEVLVIGGGAAGIAAARRLHDAGVDCLLFEARQRLGGRAWTIDGDVPVDLGCGWLHSAGRNPWVEIAQAQGRAIDRSPPPWTRPLFNSAYSATDRADFVQALEAFRRQVAEFGDTEPDRPASTFVDLSGRWAKLIDAVSNYYSGVELDRVSARDLGRYADDGVNWRIPQGYGATIAAHAAGLRIVLGCPVRRVDHSGQRLAIETADGTVTADAAIVTLPTSLLAEEGLVFAPALPEKTEAAAGLPLGLADKLYLSLSDDEEFDTDRSFNGRTDRTETAAYQVRPLGRPLIECYFGGALAAGLEAGGPAAFHDFAVGELTGLFGHDFARRVKPIHHHSWLADPFSRGSYSYALPGKADCRAILAAPVDGRLFFAGEACSTHDFSTAHGAYLTGITAADQVLSARKDKPI